MGINVTRTLPTMMVLAGALTTLLTRYRVCPPYKWLSTSVTMRSIAKPGSSVGTATVKELQLAGTFARRSLKQPLWQTDQIFVGKAGCWAVIALSTAFSNAPRIDSSAPKSKDSLLNAEVRATSPLFSNPQKTKKFKLYIIAPPAFCDILSTTL